MPYLICDHLRLADLQRQDTRADTPADAQRLAADMAKEYRCRVYVLGIVGIVDCPAIEPQWVQPLEPA